MFFFFSLMLFYVLILSSSFILPARSRNTTLFSSLKCIHIYLTMKDLQAFTLMSVKMWHKMQWLSGVLQSVLTPILTCLTISLS